MSRPISSLWTCNVQLDGADIVLLSSRTTVSGSACTTCLLESARPVSLSSFPSWRRNWLQDIPTCAVVFSSGTIHRSGILGLNMSNTGFDALRTLVLRSHLDHYPPHALKNALRRHATHHQHLHLNHETLDPPPHLKTLLDRFLTQSCLPSCRSRHHFHRHHHCRCPRAILFLRRVHVIVHGSPGQCIHDSRCCSCPSPFSSLCVLGFWFALQFSHWLQRFV